MRIPPDSGPGAQTVIAAQRGDQRALEALFSSCLPLIYDIAGCALHDRADVDDVVQETMLRVIRGLRGLRDPAAFRSWLVAIAPRQIRDYQQARQATSAGDFMPDMADPCGLTRAERPLIALPLVPSSSGTATGTARGGPGRRRQARSPGGQAPRAGPSRARGGRVRSRPAGSLRPKLAVGALVAFSVAAGSFALAYPQRAHPAAPASPAPGVRSVAAPPVTAAIGRPEARPLPGHPRPATPVRAAPAARAAPVPAASPAPWKGVSAWTFLGVSEALAKSGASWYYTWSSNPAGIASPPGVDFVPMIWGAGSVNPATLSQAKHFGHVLLGFNEPDNSAQSNMTVSQALRLWPALMVTGMRLGSPAVAANAATPDGWLDRFMRGATAPGYRVNFIAEHWYGADFATRPAVLQLKSYLQAIYARYHLPIWLTEFALTRFGATASFPTWRQQAAFLTASASMLDHLTYVHRYAWFALPVTPTDGTVCLFGSGAIATAVGQAFEAVGAAH